MSCQVFHVSKPLRNFTHTTSTSRAASLAQMQSTSYLAWLCATAERFRHLATCSADTTVKVWSISHNYEFKHEKTLIGHQRWVWDCAFSADSAYLVTGDRLMIDPRSLIHKVFAFTASSDHTARLWEMASGETVRQYNGHHKGQL